MSSIEGEVYYINKNLDLALYNSLILNIENSNIGIGQPGMIRYNKNTDKYEGYVRQGREFVNGSNFVPMSLDVATSSSLGGFKLGNNLSITSDGKLNSVASAVSRKFQKILIISASLQENNNKDSDDLGVTTGDYRSINQCINQFFGYNKFLNTFPNGELASLNKIQYPDPSINNKYIIQLTPGEYKEDLDLVDVIPNSTIDIPPFVCLIGDDRDSCVINIKNLTSIIMRNNTSLKNLTIDLTNANENLTITNTEELIKGIDILTSENNIIIENVIFKLDTCNLNTSFIYSNTNNNVIIRNITMKSESIEESINNLLDKNEVEIKIINIEQSQVILDNLDIYLETDSHNKSIVYASNFSAITCINSKLEIKESNLLDISITNQALYLIDSIFTGNYCNIKCLGYDNNFVNTNIRNQGIRLDTQNNYNKTQTTQSVFIHNEENISHDIIQVPISNINLSNYYTNGSKIKIIGTVNNNSIISVSYIKNDIINQLDNINGSILGCDISTVLVDEIVNNTGIVIFKELYQVNLFTSKITSDSEVIKFDGSDLTKLDNYYINCNQTQFNGVNPNIGNNILIFDNSNEIIVGKENSNFNNITDALHSINDASINNKYVIYIKSGTYLESKQLFIPSYVSLIGENVIVKFASNPIEFPENVCMMLSSNVKLSNIEFIFDKIQDNTKTNIAIATNNYKSTFENNINNEVYFTNLESITNIEFNNITINITDNFINLNKLRGLIFIKMDNSILNNINLQLSHSYISNNLLDTVIIYNKLTEINYNNININITGSTTDINYNICKNDACRNSYNNPDILINISPSTNNPENSLRIIETNDSFVNNNENPNLSIYNTFILGGTIKGYRNTNLSVVEALIAEYNSTLIGANIIIEGDTKDRNNPQNNYPNSLLKTMNCFGVSRNGDLVADITEISPDGGQTITSQSLHIGHLVGVSDNIPFYNLLSGIRVATLNTTGSRNVMLGVDVGTSQQSGNNNVYIGNRVAIKALQSDNVFIGSNAGSNIEQGMKNVFIGSDSVNNGDNINKSVIIGNNTGININNLENGIIIGDSSINVDLDANIKDLIVLGSNVGNNMEEINESIIMGNNNLSNIITSNQNILMGHNILKNVLNASKNIYIGNNTGSSVITSNNSIIIGENNLSSGVDTYCNNNLIMGNRAMKNATTAMNNVVLGTGVARNLTTGSRNILIGQENYNLGNTTSPGKSMTTGSDNILMGSNVGTNLINGNRNFILGNNSGNNLNLTSDTIILGYNSGNTLTGGNNQDNQNIIIGNEAGKSATSGKVIIIGHEAGQKSIGNDSLIIGNKAGRTIAGPRNTIIGNKAAGVSNDEFNPVLGQDNVLIGTHSGFELTTGNYNIILGSGEGSNSFITGEIDNAGAGYSLKSGDMNFIAGYNAGRKLQSGSENILIGSRAGSFLNQSNRNVIIGNNAGKKLGANDSQEANSENNVIIGNNAGKDITLGNDLLFIGLSAGEKSIQGQENTYIGNYTGQYNNGSKNTFIGNRSGNENKGNNNTFIGVNSGRYSESASFNTLIGYEAGRGATNLLRNNGDFNTFIGYQSGQDITTGYRNLYIGYQSGQKNRNGSKNIMLGPNSGLNSTTSKSIFIGSAESNNGGIGFNTTGELNVLIGPESGVAVTTGERNVMLGSYTGQNVSTASSSVLIGADAGQNITTGDNNVLLGPLTGNKITIGTNNIMIGDRAGNEATTNSSENILIGTLAGSKTEINESINIGNKAGQNNQTGIGNILIGKHAGQKLEKSNNNIMIGSNAGSKFYPTGSNITLGENIYIGAEVGKNNITGYRNIVMGSDAFKSSVQGSGVIAIGYKAGENAGILDENVGGKTYENTLIGFEAGSQGDFGNKNVMIGSQSGRNVNNGRKFEGNVLLGAESGKNSNLSENSVILGSANKKGKGGVNNVIIGTDTADNLGNDLGNNLSNKLLDVNLILSDLLSPGENYILLDELYNNIISRLSINDRLLVDDGINLYESTITSITEKYGYDILKFYVEISMSEPYIGSDIIEAGAKILLLSNIDNNNGNIDKSRASSNTIMGNKSSINLKTGSKNVSLGDQSMHENIIGKYNNILGTQAGYNTKTDNNTLFGTKAGYYIDNYIGNEDITYKYIGFKIIDNAILIDDNDENSQGRFNFISSDLDFGSIIDIKNTTGNNKRVNIKGVFNNEILFQGFPQLEEIGVPTNINPNSIIINNSQFSINSDSNRSLNINGLEIKKGIFINEDNKLLPYTYIKNVDDTIASKFEYIYQIKIRGSKFNDGVYYLFNNNSSIDNLYLRTYNNLFPEIFDSEVEIISSSISTNTITSGFSFQDINIYSSVFAFIGLSKGIYNVSNQESKYNMLKPLNNTIFINNNDINFIQKNKLNNIYSIGHIQNFSSVNNDNDIINTEILIPIGNIIFLNDYINNNGLTGFGSITFENPIDLEVGEDVYYKFDVIDDSIGISILQSNNIYFNFASDLTNNKKEYEVYAINTKLYGESGFRFMDLTVESTLLNPIKMSRIELLNLSRNTQEILPRNSIINMNITHSLGQKVINGSYIIENNLGNSNKLLFNVNNSGSGSLFPKLISKYNIGQTSSTIDAKDVNLKINKEIYNIDDSYMNSKNNQINGYDLMFQSFHINNLNSTLILKNNTNTIETDIKYLFKDLLAPCMIKLDDIYYLVKSNKYPFTTLEINNNYIVEEGNTTSLIFVNSISTYQNGTDLSLMEQDKLYTVFGNSKNHLVNIKSANNSLSIHRQSVYLSEDTLIENYQSNNKLIVVECKDDKFSLGSFGNKIPFYDTFGERLRGCRRGYFKHIDLINTNNIDNLIDENNNNSTQTFDILYDSFTTEYEKINVLSNNELSKKEFVLIPDSRIENANKYNLLRLDTITSFTSISDYDTTFTGENIINIINFPSGFTFMNNIYNFVKISIKGYLLFESFAHRHVFHFLTLNDNSTNDINNNYIKELEINSTIKLKFNPNIDDNGSSIIIDFNSDENIIGFNGINNCRIEIFLNDSVIKKGRIYIKYSNIESINNSSLLLGLDSTETKIKENRLNTLTNDNYYNSPMVNINIDNYETYNNKKLTFTNNFINSKINTTILASDNENNMTYGISSSIYGNYIAIGSNGINIVDVYKINTDNTFTKINTLIPIEEETLNFGYSLSMDGDFLVVGAPQLIFNGVFPEPINRVYVYKKNNLGDSFELYDTITHTITNSDDFGFSVSISGDYIGIGSPASNGGYAYIYKNNIITDTFDELTVLSTIPILRGYGKSIALNNEYIVVGSPEILNGLVYVYKNNNDVINNIAILNPSDGDGISIIQYGLSIGVYNGNIIIGAPFSSSGKVYFYRNNGNDEFTEIKILSFSNLGQSHFGSAVDIYDKYLIIRSTQFINIFEIELNNTYKEINQLINTFNTNYYKSSISIYNKKLILGIPTNVAGNSGEGMYIDLQNFKYDKNYYINSRFTFYNNKHFKFGSSIDLNNNYIVISEEKYSYFDYGNNIVYNQNGLVYIKKNNNGVYTDLMQLNPSFMNNFQRFGTSLSLFNNYLAIGADNTITENGMNHSGSVYIYKNNIATTGIDLFEEIDILFSNNIITNGDFGSKVFMYEDYLLIRGTKQNNSISIYVYKNNGNDKFIEIANLKASNSIDDDNFGYSFSMSGNYIVISSPYKTNNSFVNSGCVYIYKNNGNDIFTEISIITSSDLESNSYFGYSVSIENDYLVISETFINDDNNSFNNKGKVYLYKNNGNDIFNKINTFANLNLYLFGKNVLIKDKNILITSGYNENISGLSNLYIDNGDNTYDVVILHGGSSNSTDYPSAISMYNNMIIISDDNKNTSKEQTIVYLYNIKKYRYDIDYYNDNINTINDINFTTYTDNVVLNDINFILGKYNINSITINKNGYIYVNEGEQLFNNEFKLLDNNYISLLNNVDYDNIKVKNDLLMLSFIFDKNNYTICQVNLYKYNDLKIEIILTNLDKIESYLDNTTLGLNLLNNNDYLDSSRLVNKNNTKIIKFNDELQNINLIQPNDILTINNYGNYEIKNVNINNKLLLIYNSLSNEVYNELETMYINEYVSYDEKEQEDIFNFEKLRLLTGEHSDFLRFLKIRQPDLKNEYNKNKNTINNYNDITLMDKGLNYSVDTSVFSNDNLFTSNVVSKHVIPLLEIVPNEYYGSDSANIELRKDFYTIALGEPVFKATNLEEEIININTPPKGFIDMFVKNDNPNNKDYVIFNSNSSINENYTGNITITDTSIIISELEISDTSNYITSSKFSGIKTKNMYKPFNILKPNNIISIYKNNEPINDDFETYMISDYSIDGLTININPILNNTPLTKTSFTPNDNLQIVLLLQIDSDEDISNFYNITAGQLISERYDFTNFKISTSIIDNLQNNNSLYNNLDYIAVCEYPILNIDLQEMQFGIRPNYINYMIPDWGFRPFTQNINNNENLSTLDFAYFGGINLETNLLDYGEHTLIIPSDNITQNLDNNIIQNSDSLDVNKLKLTNIYFKRNIFENKDLIFNIVDYTFINYDNNINNIDFTVLDKGQLIRFINNELDIEIILQVSLTINPLLNLLTLEKSYQTKLTVDNYFNENNIVGNFTLEGSNIYSHVIMSRNSEKTDLSIFKPGQKITILNTQFNNGLKYIYARGYTNSKCLLIGTFNADGNINDFRTIEVVNENPNKCIIENIILQNEVGSFKNKEIIISEFDNSLKIETDINTDNSFSSFTTNQEIVILNSTLNNGEYKINSNINPTSNTIILNNTVNNGETKNMDLYKNIYFELVGKPIISSTTQENKAFHYQDAQGNNMMLGSFTGQFCGYKNLAIHNSYIGNKVGQTNHGSGNIFFGNETGLATKATDGESFYNNKFAIYKNNFIGVPDKPLIGGDFSSGRVGINTIEPDNLLSSTLENTTKLVVNGAVRASSHNTFTGTHIITFSKDSNLSDIEPGMIVSSTGKIHKLGLIDTIVECKLTTIEKDKKVFGVYFSNEKNIITKKNNFNKLDTIEEIVYYVAGLGEGQIWVSNINGNVETGDYICSSIIAGYTQLQDDDLTHNYTIGKITEDINWDNINKYKAYNGKTYKIALVGCIYMCS